MKATGIVRKVDQLGRVVIPAEMRRTLGIDIEDPMEINTDGTHIIISKFEPYCMICGNVHGLVEYRGRRICKKCLDEFIKSACDESK